MKVLTVKNLVEILNKCKPDAEVYFGEIDLTEAATSGYKPVTTIYEGRLMDRNEVHVIISSEQEGKNG